MFIEPNSMFNGQPEGIECFIIHISSHSLKRSYSLRNDLTGLTVAARMVRNHTVIAAMVMMINPAMMNIPAFKFIR